MVRLLDDGSQPNQRRRRRRSLSGTSAKRRNDESSLSRTNRRSQTMAIQYQTKLRPMPSQAITHSHPSISKKDEEHVHIHAESSATSKLAKSMLTTSKTSSSNADPTRDEETPEPRSRSQSPHPHLCQERSTSWEGPSQSQQHRPTGRSSSCQSWPVDEAIDYPEGALEKVLRDSSPERQRPQSKSPHLHRTPKTRLGSTKPIRSFQAVESPRFSDHQDRQIQSPIHNRIVQSKSIQMKTLDEPTKSPDSRSKSRMRHMMKSISPMNTFDGSTWATSSSLKNPPNVGSLKTESLDKAQTPMSHAIKACRSESNLARKKRQGSKSIQRMRPDNRQQVYHDPNSLLSSSPIEQLGRMILGNSNLSIITRDSLICDDYGFLDQTEEGSETVNSVSSVLTGNNSNNEDVWSSDKGSRSDSEATDDCEPNESGGRDNYSSDYTWTHNGVGFLIKRSTKPMDMSPSSKSRRLKHSVRTASTSKNTHKSARVDAQSSTIQTQCFRTPSINDKTYEFGQKRNAPQAELAHFQLRERVAVLDTGKSWKSGVLEKFSRSRRTPSRTTQEINVEHGGVKHVGGPLKNSPSQVNLSTGGIVRTNTNSIEVEAEWDQQQVNTRPKVHKRLETAVKTPQNIVKKKSTTHPRFPLRKRTISKDSVIKDMIKDQMHPISTTAEPRRTALHTPRNQANHAHWEGTTVGPSMPVTLETNRLRMSNQSQMCYVRLTPLYLSGVSTEKLRWKSTKGTENRLVHGFVAHVNENGAIESQASLALSQPITPKLDSKKTSSYCLVWSNLNASDSTRGRVYISVPYHEDGRSSESSRAAPDQEIVVGIKRGKEMVQLGYAHIPIFNRNISGLDVEIEIVPFENTKKKGIFSKRKNAFENDDKVYSLEHVAILRATLDISCGPMRSHCGVEHDENIAMHTMGEDTLGKEGKNGVKEGKVKAKRPNFSASSYMSVDDCSRNLKDTSIEIIRVPSNLPEPNENEVSPSNYSHKSPEKPSGWTDLGITQMLSSMMTWNSEGVPNTDTHSLISSNQNEEDSSLRTNDESLLTNEDSSKKYTVSITTKKYMCYDPVPALNQDEPHENCSSPFLHRLESKDWYPSVDKDASPPDTPTVLMPENTISMPSIDTQKTKCEGIKRLQTTANRSLKSSNGAPSDLNSRILTSGSSWNKDATKNSENAPRSQLRRDHQAVCNRFSTIPARLPGRSKAKSLVPKKWSLRNECPNDEISINSGYKDIVDLEKFIMILSGGMQNTNHGIKSDGPRLATAHRSMRDNESQADVPSMPECPSSTDTSSNSFLGEGTEGNSAMDIPEMPIGCLALNDLSFAELTDSSESNASFESLASSQESKTQGSSVVSGNYVSRSLSSRRMQPSRGERLYKKEEGPARNTLPCDRRQPHQGQVQPKYKAQLKRRSQSQGISYAKANQHKREIDDSIIEQQRVLRQERAGVNDAPKEQKLHNEGLFLEKTITPGLKEGLFLEKTITPGPKLRSSDVSSNKNNASHSLGSKLIVISPQKIKASFDGTYETPPSVGQWKGSMVDVCGEEDRPLSIDRNRGTDSAPWNTSKSSTLPVPTKQEEVSLTAPNNESFTGHEIAYTSSEQDDSPQPKNIQKKEADFHSKCPHAKSRPENHPRPLVKVALPEKVRLVTSTNGVSDKEPLENRQPPFKLKETEGIPVLSKDTGANSAEYLDPKNSSNRDFQNSATRNDQSRNQGNEKDLMSSGAIEGHSQHIETTRVLPNYPDFQERERPSKIDSRLASFDSSVGKCLGDAVASVFVSIFGPDERRMLGNGYSKDIMVYQRDDDAFIDHFGDLKDGPRYPAKESSGICRILPDSHLQHGPENQAGLIKTYLDGVPLVRENSESSNLHLLLPPSLRRSKGGPKDQRSAPDEKSPSYEEGFEMILHNHQQESTKRQPKMMKRGNSPRRLSQNVQNEQTLQTRYGLNARTPLGSSRVGRNYNDSKLDSLNSDVDFQTATPSARNTGKSIQRFRRYEDLDQLQNLEGPGVLNSISFSFSETGCDQTPPGSESHDFNHETMDNPTLPDKRDTGSKNFQQKKWKSRQIHKTRQYENVFETDDGAGSVSKNKDDVENVTMKLYQISKKLGLTPEELLSQLETVEEEIGISSRVH